MAKKPRQFEIDNPKEIFDHAESFIIASKAINQSAVKYSLGGDPNEGIVLSLIAKFNHAFAFELYLKCLMSLETGRYFEGHDLLKLFKMLSQETQDEIIKNHDTLTVYRHPTRHGFGFSNEGKFIELLTEAANTFVDYRYVFNKPNVGNYNLDFPLKYLRSMILKKRPDFKSE